MSSIENVKVELMRAVGKHDDMAARLAEVPAAAEKVAARIGRLAAQLEAIQAEIRAKEDWPEVIAVNEITEQAAADAREAEAIIKQTLGIAWDRNVNDLPLHVASVRGERELFSDLGTCMLEEELHADLPFRAIRDSLDDAAEQTQLVSDEQNEAAHAEALRTKELVEQYIAEL